MSGPRLRSLMIRDFRSIRGTLQLPLDANVVLIHGENGAGKTSVLSAIELGLTGGVVALERADGAYTRELTNKDADSAQVELTTVDLQGPFGGTISKTGQLELKTLPARLSNFFSERCYLPQSLLGQLLQIYQESGTAADSPLSRFVTELLGLDRLDAIETGLQPTLDLRHLRKTTDSYAETEAGQDRLDHEIRGADAALKALMTEVQSSLAELAGLLTSVGGPADGLKIENLDVAREFVDLSDEVRILQEVENERRALRSIASEGQATTSIVEQNEQALADAHNKAQQALLVWLEDSGAKISALRQDVVGIDPTARLDIADPLEFVEAALPLLRALRLAMTERQATVKVDEVRRLAVREELTRLAEQVAGIDREIALAAKNPAALVNVLAEITAHIDGEVCPVCDRDYSDLGKGRLANHVSQKVRTLSTAAARLLDLTRSRAARQAETVALETEATELEVRQVKPEDLDAISRRLALVTSLEQRLLPLHEPARVGSDLTRREAAARRALAGFQQASRVQLSLKDNIVTFASREGFEPVGPLETAGAAISRLDGALTARAAAAEVRATAKRRAAALIDDLVRDREELATQRAALAELQVERKAFADALKRAAQIRRDGQAIEGQVKALRAKIIGREFNDRLNTLWRDLFVRLAPNEPFVPAFHVPEKPTLRLQPKLITLRRDGTPGGAPGAMLSAGNLNTAALTLFVSLHLTMKSRLPWLILDDPVQSMDDVHIAHFASLLRTLSKQHSRQIIVAVHDRQLFEYLKLELSPASATEELLAIELIKTKGKDTERLVERRLFREEAALRFAA